MTKSKVLGIALLLGAFLSLSAEAKNYKWVDEKGETQYGEVVPPEFANKDKVQIDDKGRVVKSKEKDKESAVDSSSSESRKLALKAAAEQRRKDKALLNTYSNEKEIDLARERNLQQVEANINSIKLLQKSAQDSLDSFRKEVSGLKAGKQIPASLQADISASENKVEKLKQDLEAANSKAATVRANFEADKIRYRELTGADKK
jgi:hypothetical protein